MASLSDASVAAAAASPTASNSAIESSRSGRTAAACVLSRSAVQLS
jgi:hypothetical protein